MQLSLFQFRQDLPAAFFQSLENSNALIGHGFKNRLVFLQQNFFQIVNRKRIGQIAFVELKNVGHLQLNKRDLPSALPVDDLKKVLLKKGEPVFEAVAYQGVGVFETLKECGRQVLAELKKG